MEYDIILPLKNGMSNYQLYVKSTIPLGGYMFVSIDKNDDLPITVQLYNIIKDSILQGIIPSNTKVPSTRVLAQELQIARSTVVGCSTPKLIQKKS